jgi:hypothetical protein
VRVDVALDDLINAELASASLRSRGAVLPVEIEGVVEGDAMIDTGADSTVLDLATMEEMGLEPTGTLIGQGVVHGRANLPIYSDVSVRVVDGPEITFDRVVGADIRNLGIVALLGRDMLADSKLVYHGRDGFFALESPSGTVVSQYRPIAAVFGTVALAGLVGAVVYGLRPECPPCVQSPESPP